MHQRVRSQSDEGSDVVGGRESHFADATDDPDVTPDLGPRTDPHSDQVERRVSDDLGYDHAADEPGTPDNYTLWNRFALVHGNRQSTVRTHEPTMK